ncbi:MAG TPA: hypothetical protein VFU05_18220 [Cyclobacteriaceae bacterium]|nr:hypothetical protein [Cyclobacteriaceae bacterium]
MRIIGEIPHSQCKVTLYHWNNRYLIKLEKNGLEQTFKVDQFELASDKDLQALVDELFIQKALIRFDDMERTMSESLQKL